MLLLIPVMGFGQIQDSGLIFFDEPGEVTNFKEFEVFQPLYKGSALAYALSDGELAMHLGPVVLLYQEDKYYYDEEIVRTPKKSVERQIGVFRYKTKKGEQKTVPIIEFEDKKSLSSGNVSREMNKKGTKTIKVVGSIAEEVKAINDYIREHSDKADEVKILLDNIIKQLN